MSKMTYGEALREAMSIRMREDENVILFGEDVGAFGGCFGVSAGMIDEFGEERVRDTPISESAIVGLAVGSSATGIKPIAELMFADFLTVSMDQVVNQAAKMRYMFGGKIALPMVLRLPNGAGVSAAAQHSQSPEAWVAHVPGLKVVYPSTPQDAMGLMLSAIDDEDPVMFFEHKALYAVPGEVTHTNPIPIGKGDIKRAGDDITVVATGKLVHDALKAAEELAKEGIDVEVLDPRSLYPLDMDLIAKSLEKTNRLVIATEENKRGAYSGEIAARVVEDYFDLLDAPIYRVGALDSPVPFAPVLEQYYLPNHLDIIEAVRKMG